MREVMVFEPGDKVRYVGEKALTVVLPSRSAYVAGRGELGTDPFNEAWVEKRFSIYVNSHGVVVPLPGILESSEYAVVEFKANEDYFICVPISHSDLEVM